MPKYSLDLHRSNYMCVYHTSVASSRGGSKVRSCCRPRYAKALPRRTHREHRFVARAFFSFSTLFFRLPTLFSNSLHFFFPNSLHLFSKKAQFIKIERSSWPSQYTHHHHHNHHRRHHHHSEKYCHHLQQQQQQN